MLMRLPRDVEGGAAQCTAPSAHASALRAFVCLPCTAEIAAHLGVPQVEERYPGAYHPELRYLTVGSRAQGGALPWARGEAGLLASTLAYASYLPLCGDGEAVGDGITPLRCAHLEGAEQREPECFHIAYVPGVRARLRGTPWYGSPGVLEQWADFLA